MRRKRYTPYPIPETCPYCENDEIVLTTNDALYGRKFYKGNNCNIYLALRPKALKKHSESIASAEEVRK